jgi:copper transport protein
MGHRRLLLLLAAVGGGLACLLLIVTGVSAHAELRRTTPADGAVLQVAPAEVVLEFNEPVRPVPGANRVLDSRGRQVDGGVEQDGSGRRVVLALPAGLADDVYTTVWRVISADGHPVGGAFVFTVGSPPARTRPLAAPPSAGAVTRWEAAAAVSAAALLFAALTAAGTVPVSRLFWHEAGPARASAGRWTAIAAATGAVAVVPGFGIQAVLVSGGGLADMFDRSALQTVFESSFGQSRLTVLIACLLLSTSLLLPARRLQSVAAWAGSAGVVAGLVLTGHPRTAEPAWLVMPAAVLHTATAAFWLGGLVVIALFFRSGLHRDMPVAPIVRRFAGAALVTVAALAVAGTLLAASVLPSIASLWESTYGRILLAKVAVLGCLLVPGAVNHWCLVPGITSPRPQRWFRRTVLAEVVLIGLVVALTGWLVTTSPPSAKPESNPATDVTSLQLGPYHADLAVESPRDGHRRFTLTLHAHGTGTPLPSVMTFQLANLDQDSGPITREVAHAGDGSYVLEGPEASIAGRWEVRVRVRLSDFRLAEGRFRVTLR